MTAKTQTAPLDLVVAPRGMLGDLRVQQAELLDQIRAVEAKLGDLRHDAAAQESILAGELTTDQEIAAATRLPALRAIMAREQNKLAGLVGRYDALKPSVKQLEEERTRLLEHEREHTDRLARWAAIEAELQPIDQELLRVEQFYHRMFPQTCERLAQARILVHATIGEQDQRRGALAQIARRLEEIGE